MAEDRTLRLVRDVLDEHVLDRDGETLGKVDTIVLELRAGKPPRVAALEVGPPALARRLHPALGRAWAGLERLLGAGDGEPHRIPFPRITAIERDLRVDVRAASSPALAWERWLRRRLVDKLPGGGP